MAGIRVPDAQYEAPTPTPEQAQIPMPKQPQANPNMFGAAQAAAGEKAGAEVKTGAIDIADRLLQMKQWNQQSQMYNDKESYRAYMENAANDLTTHDVVDPKTGETRQVPNGWNNITDQRDLGNIPQMVADAKTKAMQLYGPQQGTTLLSVAKMYSRYLGGIDSIYNDQATKHIVNQTKQNTVANFQAGYQKAMQATGTFNSFLDYHNNVNDISLWKNAGVSATTGSTLSAKEMQGLLKQNFSQSGQKFYQDKIWSGQMTAEQANKDLDASVAKMSPDAVGDVGVIKKEIETQADAYQTAQKKQGEQVTKDNTNKGVAMVGAGVLNARNISALATMGVDPKLVDPLTNAVLNVETKQVDLAKKAGFKTTPEVAAQLNKIPIAKENLGIDFSGDGEKTKTLSDAADSVMRIVQSESHEQARNFLVSAIQSDKLDKEQLNVYTRTLALVGQFLPTETEAAQGKAIAPEGVAQVGGLKDLASWGQKANLPDLSHLKQYLDNNDNKINPQDNVNSVKTNVMNNMFPQTVGSGKTPNIVVSKGGSQRYFMQRATDPSAYPFMYDEGSKMVVPNQDYKQPRPTASKENNGAGGT